MQKERQLLLNKIAAIRGTNVMCYITGDRGSLGTRIAPDAIPVFYEHLNLSEKGKPLDLLLYTKGGDVLTALRLVELIYEYTDRFSVLIPYRSYSAGTLISLGASEIIMGRMGELSPIDPKVSGIFNPSDPYNNSAKVPISVEDVSSYFTIASELVGIHHEESLTQIFSMLLNHIHPLALGSVYRTYSLIRSVAEKLLTKHMNQNQHYMIPNIIDYLTTKSYSHDYMITRKEARDSIKLPVIFAEGEMEMMIWQLYKDYEQDLKLKEPFAPEQVEQKGDNFTELGGFIESIYRCDCFTFHGNIIRSNNGESQYASTCIVKQGWEECGRSI